MVSCISKVTLYHTVPRGSASVTRFPAPWTTTQKLLYVERLFIPSSCFLFCLLFRGCWDYQTNRGVQDRSKSDRIRDNQRRSRQRKKEYLQDLEDKVKHLKAEKVKGSMEMQAAARKVQEHNNLLMSENRNLREVVLSLGVPIDELEDRLKAMSIEGIPRRGSKQAQSWTVLTKEDEFRTARLALDASLRPQDDDDDDDDNDEDEDDQLLSPMGHLSTGKRPSLSLKPSRRTKESLISPIRPPDSMLLSQPGPRSISSSAASTPSVDGQTTGPSFANTLPDPRMNMSRQLAPPPPQADIFGVPPQMYAYGMPTQSPAWRHSDFPPVSMQPPPPGTYVPTGASTISMLPPMSMISTTVVYHDSSPVTTMPPGLGQQIQHESSRRYRNDHSDAKPESDGQSGWRS
jgi:hypothetical protein